MQNEPIELLIACKSGLEAVVKRELLDFGIESEGVTPGRVLVHTDVRAIPRANLYLRSADRILLRIGHFPARDFDELFEGVRSLAWERWLPRDAAIHIRGRCVRSQLASEPAVQRATNKALVDRLLKAHQTSSLPETGVRFDIDVTIIDDVASLTIDTTGVSLHKRGYRELVAEAPLQETIAASMVLLSPWTPDRPFVDPFCGSGTIPIEAAMIALRIPPGCIPGCERLFAAEDWPTLDRSLWPEARDQARAGILRDQTLTIMGYDIDGKALDLARHHAHLAGVSEHIHFQQRPFADLRSGKPWGVIVTNPPYGERLGDYHQVDALYASFPEVFNRLPTWSQLVLTSYPNFERAVGRVADRRRKLHNADIECTLYQYLGPRPGDHTPAERFTAKSVASPAKSAPIKPVHVPIGAHDALDVMTARQIETFTNRLTTRARHFRKWPEKFGTDTYRLFDHDIPDVPVVVDRIGGCAVIFEVMGPRNRRTFEQHQQWLSAVAGAVANVLEIPRNSVFIRHKMPRAGAKLPNELIGDELGAKLPFDPSLAPELALDLRGVHTLVRELVADRRVLVVRDDASAIHALLAGATQVTLIESQRAASQRFVRALSLNQLSTDSRFKLLTAAPPTAISSMPKDQRFDFAVINAEAGPDSIRAALARLVDNAPALIYSKQSGADISSLLPRGVASRDLTQRAVPEDFRDKSPLRCWRIG